MKKNLLLTILTTIMAVIVIFPFFYAISGSFFSASDFTSTPAHILPSQLRWSNYAKVFTHRYFNTYLLNSIITGVLGTAIRMVLAVAAAYAFSFFRFKGRNLLLGLLLGTMFVPSDLLLVQNYITVQHLGLLDTYLGIISTSLLPVAQILMLRQFFLSVPASIHDSARMDGCSDGRFIISILIPLSKAVLSALLLQSFVTIFNSYLWPLLVTNRPKMRTVQVGITMLGFAESLNYGPIFAAIVVILIPFLILFILMRGVIMKALSKGYMYI